MLGVSFFQAVKLNLSPLYLMLPGCVACSFAFMLPVATPPNAIIYSGGHLKVIEMVRCCLCVNVTIGNNHRRAPGVAGDDYISTSSSLPLAHPFQKSSFNKIKNRPQGLWSASGHMIVGSGGRVVERRTVNRGDGGSIPPTAILKLRQFRSPHICLCLSEETLKVGGHFYLVSMAGEVKGRTV